MMKRLLLILLMSLAACLYLRADGLDPDFVQRPEQNWTLKLVTKYDWTQMYVRGDAFNATLKSQPRIKEGISVSFRGVGLGVNFTLGEKLRNSIAISLHSYGRKFCNSLDFIHDKTLSGTMSYGDMQMTFNKGSVAHTSLNYDAWYIFNGNKFSFPAAFNQNRIQKRSAGSFLLSASYKGNWNKFLEGPLEKIQGHTLALGGGYGFNLVAGPMLFHASLLGNIVALDTTRYILEGVKEKVKYGFPSFMATANVALFFNIKRFFIGAMASGYDCAVGSKKQVRMDFLRIYSSFVLGVRL